MLVFRRRGETEGLRGAASWLRSFGPKVLLEVDGGKMRAFSRTHRWVVLGTLGRGYKAKKGAVSKLI